jgi:hypothetical protein
VLPQHGITNIVREPLEVFVFTSARLTLWIYLFQFIQNEADRSGVMGELF